LFDGKIFIFGIELKQYISDKYKFFFNVILLRGACHDHIYDNILCK